MSKPNHRPAGLLRQVSGESSPGLAWKPLITLALVGLSLAGCNIYGRPQRQSALQATLDSTCQPDPATMPAKELAKITLPPYVIEPPDILMIEALRVVPKPPFRIQSFDTLRIDVANTLLDNPISGDYVVEPGGNVDLGPTYGKVNLQGKSLDEAQDAVTRHLARILRGPQVSLTLTQAAGLQQVAGEHAVGPDGTVNLGIYGQVYVTGMTLQEAKTAIEKQLSNYLDAPVVAVDIFAYNSKYYYVITEGGGLGDQVAKQVITGNETVLDALADVTNGLSQASSKDIWIARPAPSGIGCDQILPVDIEAIMKGGSTATNYQLLPGDRVFISQDPWFAFNSIVDKITAPFERMLGFTLIGATAIQQIARFGQFGVGFF